jgi:NitT/TauT family transport system substrate-binding protein
VGSRIWALLLGVALGLSACGGSSSAPAPGKPVSITVNWTAVTGANSGLWTAFEAGYFKNENLDVQLTHIASSSRAIPALVAGEIQLGTADGLNLVQAVGTGADVKAVMGVTNRLVFSVMASSRVRTPQDLKGKKLGITRVGSSTHTAALQALRGWGLEPGKDVTFIPLSEVPNILTALQSNQIDAGVVSPPTNSEAKKLGFKELINLAVDGPAYASVTIAVKNSFLAGNRDTVTRFIRAYARGVHRFKTDKKYGMQATNKYLKLDDQGVLEDTWNQFSKYLAEPPYIQGFEAVIDDAAIQDAKLKGATPGQFMDMSVVKQLDDSGYFKRL